MPVRKAVFWAHLAAGIISGLSIGMMCFTGAALAFEKELIAWTERDARHVEISSAQSPRLTLDELQRRFREAQPESRAASIVVQNDPHAAVAFTTGRSGGFYANPYTGEVRRSGSAAMSRFMQTMNEWHRTLGFTGETSRPRGKLINGVCNVAFFLLAVTGLYLWLPRSWSWRRIRPAVWFTRNASAKAREWNWHNVIGLWSAPVLIVLTLTALPISFRWAGNLIYTLTGTEAPAPGAGAFGGPTVEIPPPPASAQPLSQDALLTIVQKQMPDWKTITLRTGNGGPSGRGGPGGLSGRGMGEGRPRANEVSRSAGPQAVTFTVRESSSWPRTATTTLTLNPHTGEVLRRIGYADMNAAQQVRSWTRFLHTGEALGGLGQFVAGLACVGGVFLVYTGFALAARRFFGRRSNDSETSAEEATEPSRELVES